MSAGSPEGKRWTPRQWAWIIGGGVLVHVLLIWFLGERAQPVGIAPSPDPWLRLAVDEASIKAVAVNSLLIDPTLFALPNPNGFSGGAWLRPERAELKESSWTEPPLYLPIDTNELGTIFLRFLETNRNTGSVLENILVAHSKSAEVLLVVDPAMTQSVVSVEGPLATRRLASPIQPSNPAYADVLPSTRVEVKVTWEGWPESTVLERSCGVKAVDEEALALAKSCRFKPEAVQPSLVGSASQGLTWGTLVFQWLTVPPTLSNSASVKTSP